MKLLAKLRKPKRIYNHKPDVLDGTEMKFGVTHHVLAVVNLPPKLDLRTTKMVPAIFNQLTIGDCLGNETSNALRFCLSKEGKPTWSPSRLFLYYFGRMMDGSNVTKDTGMSYTGCFNAIKHYGVCSESLWPYDIKKFAVAPNPNALKIGHAHTSIEFLSVSQDLVSIKQALNAGYPVLIGISVYESFESQAVSKTGIVPIPGPNEKCLGGHSVCIWGYDDSKQYFIVSNSWGTEWGDKGYFYLSYRYILNRNLSNSFWTIRSFV